MDSLDSADLMTGADIHIYNELPQSISKGGSVSQLPLFAKIPQSYHKRRVKVNLLTFKTIDSIDWQPPGEFCISTKIVQFTVILSEVFPCMQYAIQATYTFDVAQSIISPYLNVWHRVLTVFTLCPNREGSCSCL